MLTRVEYIDNVFTEAVYNRRVELLDAIGKSRPFFQWLTSKGRVKERPSGLGLEYTVKTAKNTTATFLGRGGTIAVSDTEYRTLAKYDWKTAAASIVRYRIDEVKVSGEQKLVDYVNDKIDATKSDLIELLEEKLTVAGGGAADPEAINSIVSATPTVGTLGTIDRAKYDWFRNKQLTSSGAATTYLISDLGTLYRDCSKGPGGTPDVHLTTQTIHELYEAEATDVRRVTDNKVYDAGFGDLTYKGAPILWSEFVPAGCWYMLNSNFIELAIDDTIPLEMTEWKGPINQVGDRVAQLVMTLGLTTGNPRKHGVLTEIHS